jgi:thioredoxin 1
MAKFKQRAPTIRSSQGKVSRVKQVREDDKHWDKLMIISHKKLVFIHYYQALSIGSQRSRPIYASLATSPQFSNVFFAEVDVDTNQRLAASQGITTVPTFQIYYQGEKVDSMSGGNSTSMLDMFKKAVATHVPTSGGKNTNSTSSSSGIAFDAKFFLTAAGVFGAVALVTLLGRSGNNNS